MSGERLSADTIFVGFFPWDAMPEPLLEPLQDLRDGQGLDGPHGG
jgi:hypothetical protein